MIRISVGCRFGVRGGGAPALGGAGTLWARISAGLPSCLHRCVAHAEHVTVINREDFLRGISAAHVALPVSYPYGRAALLSAWGRPRGTWVWSIREGLGAALGPGQCGRAGAEPRCSSSPVQTTVPPCLPWCPMAVHEGWRAVGSGRVQVRGSYGAVTHPSVPQQ